VPDRLERFQRKSGKSAGLAGKTPVPAAKTMDPEQGRIEDSRRGGVPQISAEVWKQVCRAQTGSPALESIRYFLVKDPYQPNGIVVSAWEMKTEASASLNCPSQKTDTDIESAASDVWRLVNTQGS
jgi:hypothetical protein